MHNRIRASQTRIDLLDIVEIKIDRTSNAGHRRHTVDADQLMAVRIQLTRKMAADNARRSRDNDPHLVTRHSDLM
jgi:hypothetical protein